MRRTVCAFILLALICGLPVSLALGETGNGSIIITVSATPVFAPSPPPRDNGVPPEVVPELPPAPELPVLPPPAFSVSNLSIQPTEVQPKEAITITVSVANTGGSQGSYSVVLKINGVKEAEKWVTVAAGSSEIVTFTVTREEVGSYDVTVAGLTVNFTVVAPLVPPVPPPVLPELIAPSWDSYSDLDRFNLCDSFKLHCTVYMFGKGFTPSQNYKIIYWDGQGYERVVEVQKAGPQGELSSEHTFDPPDVEGDWHCTIYPAEYDPSSYDPADTNIVADDTLYTGGYAFNIAITVIAAIGVAGLCFGIYYWMRRRYRRVEVEIKGGNNHSR